MDELIKIIETIANKIVKSSTARMPSTWNARATGGNVLPNAMGNFFINGDTSQSISIKNKTGETINNGEEAIAFSPTGSLSNMIVLYKK